MNDETLLVASIGLCLGMVVLATHMGFSAALGAFIMGSLIAEAPSAEKIEHLVKPVKDLFGAVFFVSVGMLVDPALLLEYAVPIIVLVIVTLVGKLLLSGAGVLLSGQNLNTSMHCGFSLAQIGEFSFISSLKNYCRKELWNGLTAIRKKILITTVKTVTGAIFCVSILSAF